MNNLSITDFWYDRQQLRFIEQVVRGFSGFQYQDGSGTLHTVPCTLAQTNTNVASIINGNSANTLQTFPQIVVYQTNLQFRRSDNQNQMHVDTRTVVERKIDPNTGSYSNSPGRSYTVQRLMPRPVDIFLNVDVATSNLNQKYQLVEQIITIYYPDIEIQNSENALDWSSRTRMELVDMTWNAGTTVPVNGGGTVDITTFQFKIPMWLTPPAKVQQLRRIEQIVANINEGTIDADGIVNGALLKREIITPGEFSLKVINNVLTLMPQIENVSDSWDFLIKQLGHGQIRPSQSQIRLKKSDNLDDNSQDIIGYISYDSKPNQLSWRLDPDTLPRDTIAPVDAFIDPHTSFPGHGLPSQYVGQRYLLAGAYQGQQLGSITKAWGNLNAQEFDIIQYTPNGWYVDFSPKALSAPAGSVKVTNLNSGSQFTWDGSEFEKTVDGIYPPGLWRISI